MLTFDFNKINIPDGAKVLDLGCGEGRHIFGIMDKYPNAYCVGLDLHTESLRIAQEGAEYFFKVLINRTSYELVAEIREIYEQVFKIKWHELETLEKYKIKERLRPDLGHPANVEKLEDLLQEENRRVEKVVTLVHEVHRQSMYVLEQRQVEFF
jgi:SAM-dependent methyltransferase